MKKYTDEELLNKVKSLPSFRGIPDDFWILGIQSKEDKFNEFDDKFYLFKGVKCVMVLSGTTNAGLTGLKHYDTYNPEGCAVIKTNEWYYKLWTPGLHKGKMKALKQLSPIKYYRDWNKNEKAEEIGKIREGIIGINFHTASYQPGNIITRLIGGWSTGCQVANNTSDYYNVLNFIGNQKEVSYCLIKEF
jgi:hypothetical protein